MIKKPLGRPTDPQARAARRQQIMNGARKCFVQKGFHASGMAMISAEAGVSIANIYQYFETKNDLITALVEEELSNDLAVIQALAEAENFSAGIKIAISRLAEGSDVPAMVQLRLEVLAESFRDPAVAEVVRKGEALTIKALAEILTKAKARGEFTGDFIPEEAAALILAFSDGMLSRLPIGPKPMQELVEPAFSFIAKALGLKQ